MSESNSTDGLAEMANVSGHIVNALSGHEPSKEILNAPQTWRASFPGSKQAAMGYALKYVEDLQELGIDAEREYVNEVEREGADNGHRINIHVEGGDDASDE